MSLTPQDIHHKEFRTSRFGGYNEEEVDSFLDLVADELERMIHESTDVNQQLEIVKKRVAEFEEMQTSLQSALLAASKSAEAMKDQARQEAETTVNKAQEEADSLVRTAQEQARQMILRAQSERQKLEREYAKLKEIKKHYLESIKQVAESHLSQVEELERKEGGEQAAQEPLTAPADIKHVEAPAAVEIRPAPAAVEREEPPVAEPSPAPIETATPRIEVSPPAKEIAPQEPPAVETPPAPRREVSAEAIEVEEPPPPPAAGPSTVQPGPMAQGGKDEQRPREPQAEASDDERSVPSSKLVDEVLQLEDEDNPYADMMNPDAAENAEVPDKRGKREKRDKHFFWE
jgi:cell division initiation protein